MDRNINKKVYVNPNFKGPPPLINNTWPFAHPNVPNSYKFFPQQMQNDLCFVENNPSRRIYINPNFKQVMNQNQLNSTLQDKNKTIEHMKSYPKLISKSKYSLVADVTKNIVGQRINSREDSQYNNMYTRQKADMCHQSINLQKVLIDKYQNGVPIVKSRYTIVRKNKDLSVNKGHDKLEHVKGKLSSSLKETSTKNLNVDSCNLSIFKNHEYIKSEKKPTEKVTKIKISKYKTVPITYLKKHILAIKAKEKSNYTLLQTKNTAKFNTLQFSFSKNRYKLIRSSSKPLTNVSFKAPIQALNKNDPRKTKLLKANFKVNNIPCRLFTKYGKCLRKDYGKCEYLHDKKHVSLCRKFLKGICHDVNCTLSHEVTANKMPTCFFYLKGVCIKENCPYLHVKLSEKIKICPNFLRGYCEKGDTCKLRHVKLNQPKLKINSRNKIQNKIIKLKKGKPKSSIRRQSATFCRDKNNVNPQNDDQSNIERRYYKESSFSSNEGSSSNIKPTRCKIGTLPSFIQL